MSDMKKCKHCKSEIDKKAKICPICRKKQGSPLTSILVIIIALVIISIATNSNNDPKAVDTSNTDASAPTSESTTKTTEETTSTEEVEKTTFTLGETVELNDILVTFIAATESEGSEYNKPSEGNVFVQCEFEIENNSDKDIAVSSIVSFEAYCDSYTINQSFSALAEKGDKNQLDGNVAAGKKMNGIIAYEMPSDWKELEINFTPDFWTSKDITFIATK